MLFQELKDIKSGRRERHQFGLFIGVIALLFGGMLFWRKGLHPGYFVVALVCLLPVALDKLFRTDTAIVLWPFQKIWMAIGVVLGAVMSRVVLGLFFFGVFTLVRVANDCFSKPLLDKRWAPGAAKSYWIQRQRGEYTPERTEKQY